MGESGTAAIGRGQGCWAPGGMLGSQGGGGESGRHSPGLQELPSPPPPAPVWLRLGIGPRSVGPRPAPTPLSVSFPQQPGRAGGAREGRREELDPGEDPGPAAWARLPPPEAEEALGAGVRPWGPRNGRPGQYPPGPEGSVRPSPGERSPGWGKAGRREGTPTDPGPWSLRGLKKKGKSNMAETPLRPGLGEGQAGAGSSLSNRHQPLATAAGLFIPSSSCSFFKPGDYISQRAMQGQDVCNAQAPGHFCLI
ncbi:uncharacterized protein LOC110206635 [Phascolarctos cinereus]